MRAVRSTIEETLSEIPWNARTVVRAGDFLRYGMEYLTWHLERSNCFAKQSCQFRQNSVLRLCSIYGAGGRFDFTQGKLFDSGRALAQDDNLL